MTGFMEFMIRPWCTSLVRFWFLWCFFISKITPNNVVSSHSSIVPVLVNNLQEWNQPLCYNSAVWHHLGDKTNKKKSQVLGTLFVKMGDQPGIKSKSRGWGAQRIASSNAWPDNSDTNQHCSCQILMQMTYTNKYTVLCCHLIDVLLMLQHQGLGDAATIGRPSLMGFSQSFVDTKMQTMLRYYKITMYSLFW